MSEATSLYFWSAHAMHSISHIVIEHVRSLKAQDPTYITVEPANVREPAQLATMQADLQRDCATALIVCSSYGVLRSHRHQRNCQNRNALLNVHTQMQHCAQFCYIIWAVLHFNTKCFPQTHLSVGVLVILYAPMGGGPDSVACRLPCK